MPDPNDETTRVSPRDTKPEPDKPPTDLERDAELVNAGSVHIHDRAGAFVGLRPSMPLDKKGHLVFDGKPYALRKGFLALYDEVEK